MIFQGLFDKNIYTSEVIIVTVRNKTKLLYQQEAKSVSLNNSIGPFDILPQHENLVSLTSGEIRIINNKGEKWNINHQNGLIKVTKNTVDIAILED